LLSMKGEENDKNQEKTNHLHSLLEVR
jgi:hypothetical protein